MPLMQSPETYDFDWIHWKYLHQMHSHILKCHDMQKSHFDFCPPIRPLCIRMNAAEAVESPAQSRNKFVAKKN